MPEGHDHIFTLLNADEDHKTCSDVKLTTANCMIKSHFKSSLVIEVGVEREGVSMMRMLIGSSHSAGDVSPNAKHHYEYFNKGVCTA